MEIDPSVIHASLDAAIPDDVKAGILNWQSVNRRQIKYVRHLTGGLTDASVLVVIVNSMREPARQIILKLIPESEDGDEPISHDEALGKGSPEFAQKHLVSQPYPPIQMGGWTAMFQDIAGGSLDEYRPLSALADTTDFARPAHFTAEAVISEWDDAPHVRTLSISEFYKFHVKSKLTKNSPLRTWLHEQFGRKLLSAQAIVFPGDSTASVYLNPIPAALGAAFISNRNVEVVCGISHGDLHLENVMVPIKVGLSGESFRLIDLSKFQTSAPLTRDLANLILSLIAKFLPRLQPDARTALLEIALGNTLTRVPTEVSGAKDSVDALRSAGKGRMRDLGLIDIWELQLQLSLSAMALVYASRPRFDDATRNWFIRLSTMALKRWSLSSGVPIPTQFELLGEPIGERSKVARDTASKISGFCGKFSGSVTSIAVLSPGAMELTEAVNLGRSGWDVVVEFDPLTDNTGGAFHQLKEVCSTARLVNAVTGDSLDSFNRITNWLAANGLAVGGVALPDVDMREWRQSYLRGARKSLDSMLAAQAKPVAIVVFGNVDARVRLLVEAALDIAGDRLRIVCLDQKLPESLAEYGAEFTQCDAGLVAGAFEPQAEDRLPGYFLPTIPSGREGVPQTIDYPTIEWYGEVGELLHSLITMEAESVEGVGIDFFRGRTITWFELDSRIDVKRPDYYDPLIAKVRSLLERGGTHRWSYSHLPGAGGSSMARRLAWDLHSEYPVLYISSLKDPKAMINRIRELTTAASRQSCIVIENVPALTVDYLYNELRADSVNSLLVTVGRGSVVSPVPEGDLSRRLGLIRPTEVDEFKSVFAAQAPDRASEIATVPSSGTALQLPFFYALTAFREDYVGIEAFVRSSIDDIAPEIRRVVEMVALVHNYAGVAVPADVFARALKLRRTEPVQLAELVPAALAGIIIEEPKGLWRVSHTLIAKELLRQLLAPSPNAVQQWRVGLAGLARRFVENIHASYPEDVPKEVQDLLNRIFILRNNRDLIGLNREAFSDLIQDIPVKEARVDVLRLLAETFETEPHFWAHYGRIIGSEFQRYDDAVQAISHAISLAPEDSALWHMRGVTRRREIESLVRGIHPRVGGRVFDESSVRRLTEHAFADFDRAVALNDSSEYPYVEITRTSVFVIDAAKQHSPWRNFADFFDNQADSFYADLLDRAEDCLDSLIEIAGDDPLSDRASTVQASLLGIYDDFAAILEAWRSLLARDTLPKSMVRRRIVRILGQRARGWRSASKADVDDAIKLLDENLGDDPSDGRSIREWLMVARLQDASLDRALELVTYWVDREPTREALFYDYVLSTLAAYGGRSSALSESEIKLSRLRDRTKHFPTRRISHEWLSHGSQLGALVNRSDLSDWDRQDDSVDPPLLKRVVGRVRAIDGPTSGWLDLVNGVEAFFTPARVGFVKGRDETKELSVLLGFSYDGLRAWSPKIVY